MVKIYLYVNICNDILSNKYTRRIMRKIQTIILKDFFTKVDGLPT